MARECIRNCPVIQEILGSVKRRDLASSLVDLPTDFLLGSNTDKIVEACERSYDCQGPRKVDVPAAKGFIHVRIESEEQTVCGLK